MKMPVYITSYRDKQLFIRRLKDPQFEAEVVPDSYYELRNITVKNEIESNELNMTAAIRDGIEYLKNGWKDCFVENERLKGIAKEENLEYLPTTNSTNGEPCEMLPALTGFGTDYARAKTIAKKYGLSLRLLAKDPWERFWYRVVGDQEPTFEWGGITEAVVNVRQYGLLDLKR